MGFASWVIWSKENWHWLVLIGVAVFAYGVYENRRRERLRRKLNDAGPRDDAERSTRARRNLG